MSATRPTSNVLFVAPVALALLAEAAWTAVLSGFLQAFALRDPTLGIPAMLLACGAGLAAARWLAPRAGRRWPQLAAALTIGVAMLGWLASPEVRATLGTPGRDPLGAAIVANLGGFVAGVAFLRGMPYARLPPDPGRIASVLGIGTLGIAIVATVGGVVGDPWRARFLADTTVEVVVFLVAGLASLTLSRLMVVGSASGTDTVDWRRNPAWIALAALLLGGIAATSLATSAIAGPLVVAAMGASIPFILVLGFAAGVDWRTFRIIAITMVLMLVVAEVLRVLGAKPEAAPPIAPPAPPAQQAVATPDSAILVVIALALAAVAIVAVVTRWMRRPRVVEQAGDEERWIDHGDSGGRDIARSRRWRSPRGRGRPADAVAAYRALLEVLASRDGVRREDGETPAAHAARLREGGVGALELDLLAADYGLVRFGGVRLSDAEERRAVRRASILRRVLVGQRQDSKSAGAGPGAAAKPGEDAAPGDGPGARSRFRVG